MFTLPPDLREALQGARSMGVITGAGVSAESGIQTYRGAGGLYDDQAEGDRTVEALSARTLEADPDRTWRVVAALARKAVDAAPGRAHQALVGLESVLDRFVLLTQNVDGLHRRAGSQNLIEIHGDVLDTRCMRCTYEGRLSADQVRLLEGAPPCPACCVGTLRPDAVLFGEMLPEPKIRQLHTAFFEDPPAWIVVVGTTAVFPYIREPVRTAASGGRPTLEINPEATEVSASVRWSVRASAGEALEAVLDAVDH